MSIHFRTCEFEMDSEAYIRFLIQHHEELQLPYAFAMKLSFISSPLFLGRAMLILNEEPYRVIGAAGFVYGTSANDYVDRHICQIETTFLEPSYRHPRLFVRALFALLKLMQSGDPEVETVQFWAPSKAGSLSKLLGKFTSLPGAEQSENENLTFYKLPYPELLAFTQRILPPIQSREST
jgi:hypothetical protein